MLERLAMPLRHESVLDSPDSWKERFFTSRTQCTKKCTFIPNVWKSALDPSFYWLWTMCYYRVFCMLWFILQQCWQITAKPSSSLQSVWLSHCSTIDSVMLPCDPLPCLHCRSGEGLMSCAFVSCVTLSVWEAGQQCVRTQWEPGKREESDSGRWHKLRKGFCFVRRDLDFSGLCCFEPITQDTKFISVEGQRQQANALWHTYSSLEMNSTLWWVWDLRWSLKALLNAVFTRCQSRKDCVPCDPH